MPVDKDTDKYIKYWIGSAEHDFEVAESLFENARYDWCLFIAHLVLEKIMKALYVQHVNDFPPRTHDLIRISEMIGLDINEDTMEFLDSVNTFNISTRYPDEKLRFYKLCTKEFAEENFNRIKEIRDWLLKKICQ
ncbi:MAG: HEPN domain-containing protein [Deltaproteobacteria bacterium]|nr:HEPN domain-containing protein [Deltaproteobacteria bacterium]